MGSYTFESEDITSTDKIYEYNTIKTLILKDNEYKLQSTDAIMTYKDLKFLVCDNRIHKFPFQSDEEFKDNLTIYLESIKMQDDLSDSDS